MCIFLLGNRKFPHFCLLWTVSRGLFEASRPLSNGRAEKKNGGTPEKNEISVQTNRRSIPDRPTKLCGTMLGDNNNNELS